MDAPELRYQLAAPSRQVVVIDTALLQDEETGIEGTFPLVDIDVPLIFRMNNLGYEDGANDTHHVVRRGQISHWKVILVRRLDSRDQFNQVVVRTDDPVPSVG